MLSFTRQALRTSQKANTRVFHATPVASQIYNSISETVGRTPIVRINKMAPEGVEIYAKCEYFNPAGSVKDRLALGMITHAEQTGALKPGQTVIEATSGNTGISLAMICAERGYPLVVTMAESFSVERRQIMRRFGAKVVLTPAPLKGTGMVKKAAELAEKHGYFQPSQFITPANAPAHANTTGPEILSDFANRRLDYWCTGYGTGGTVNGAGRVMKEARPDVKIILAEPGNAALIQSGAPQKREADGSSAETHTAFNPHPIQGWTPDFIPLVTQEALDLGIIDEVLSVSPPKAVETARRLAQEEGLFTGISGGASMAVALDVAAKAPKGSVILTMLADTAERYLSTPLFEDLQPDMSEEEAAISKSTPNFQLA